MQRVLEIYDGLPVTLFLALVTLYVLFADDVRQIAFPASADFTFTIINLVCIAIFVTEITMLSIFKVSIRSCRKAMCCDSTSGSTSCPS